MSDQQDFSILLYRIEFLEKSLQQAVMTKEYVIQIKFILDSVLRTEQEVAKNSQLCAEIQKKISEQELQAAQRDADQKRALINLQSEQAQAVANLQIRLFYALCSIVGAVIVGVLIYYFTHPH